MTALLPARVRRAFREWVRDPIVGLGGQTLIDFRYWIRPYDMLADRRRWRWQRPTPCGQQKWRALSAADQAAIQDWARRCSE